MNCWWNFYSILLFGVWFLLPFLIRNSEFFSLRFENIVWRIVSGFFHSLPQCYDYEFRSKAEQSQKKRWMEKGTETDEEKWSYFWSLKWFLHAFTPLISGAPSRQCLLRAIVKWLASVLMYMLLSAITSRSYKSLKNCNVRLEYSFAYEKRCYY